MLDILVVLVLQLVKEALNVLPDTFVHKVQLILCVALLVHLLCPALHEKHVPSLLSPVSEYVPKAHSEQVSMMIVFWYITVSYLTASGLYIMACPAIAANAFLSIPVAVLAQLKRTTSN